MIKVESTGSIPLTCDRCGKVKPNGKYTIAGNQAGVMVEHKNVVYGLTINGFLCPECSETWGNIASAFWGVDIEEGVREMVAKAAAAIAKEDNDEPQEAE